MSNEEVSQEELELECELPPPGTRIRCINATDREEIKVGEVYVVAYEKHLKVMPRNMNRWQPRDWRLIAIKIPGWKENAVIAFGCFEVVK